MMDAVRHHAARPGSTPAYFASGLLMLLLALVMLPVLAAASSSRDAARSKPHLASLQIEIWPEYDRPAALVILKGEIAADVPLPAAISLRIPAASGGPSAVAYASAANSGLLNLNYDRSNAADFITLRFQAPERYFHIEYYDPLPTTTPDRSHTYTWTGDLAVERLNVVLQEPAAASGLSVQPSLDATGAGPDGLRYRSAELGAFQAGKRLDVKVRYTKTDPRTSVEIVKPKSKESTPLPSAPLGGAQFEAAGPTKVELAVWLVGSVAALGLGIWAIMMWWYGRERQQASRPSGARFCRKCGAPSAPDDRFCSKCGVKMG